MAVFTESFGKTNRNEDVTAVLLCNNRLRLRVISYAAAIQSLSVLSADGTFKDVILGYDTIQEYQENSGFLGAVCGRYANRICKGHLEIDGVTYQLDINNGANHLHGGINGFSTRNWSVASVTDNSVTFAIDSPDGDSNYPGHLRLTVTYTVDESAFIIRYQATSDKKTVCNITNHSYFNLSGHDSGEMLDQTLCLKAAAYTPTDSTQIPTGEILSVKDSPFDFTTPHRIGERIFSEHPQLKGCGGYDHNFVLNGTSGNLREFVTAHSLKTGIQMKGFTTCPGVQLYTANHLSERTGKSDAKYKPYCGFCLETQFYPDSPNHENFPSSVLEPGQKFDQTTRFEFSIE